jgi:hypothetical protein
MSCPILCRVLEREVLPENYRFVARRDRLKSAHGGVAVNAKSDLEGVGNIISCLLFGFVFW